MLFTPREIPRQGMAQSAKMGFTAKREETGHE